MLRRHPREPSFTRGERTRPQSPGDLVHVVELGLHGAGGPVQEPGDHPQHDAERQQGARDLVLHPVLAVARPRPGKEQAGHSADVRGDLRRPEGDVAGGATAQDHARHVHDGEDAQQEQPGGACEGGDHFALGHLGDHDDQAQRQQGGEDDPRPRRTTAREHVAERSGKDTLSSHAVEAAAGHQHVDQRGVGDRDHREEREELVDRDAGRADRHDLQQHLALVRDHALDAPLGDHRDHREGHQDVADDRDAEAGQHHLGEGALGVLDLLDHVHGVLEARPWRRTRSRWPP